MRGLFFRILISGLLLRMLGGVFGVRVKVGREMLILRSLGIRAREARGRELVFLRKLVRRLLLQRCWGMGIRGSGGWILSTCEKGLKGVEGFWFWGKVSCIYFLREL